MKKVLNAALIICSIVSINASAKDWFDDASFANADKIYQSAADGDTSSVEKALDLFNQIKSRSGDNPVISIRIGSLTTMQARDAFAPWNKMRYAETGLDIIDRALDSLESSNNSPTTVRTVPEVMDAQFNAAVTFSSMPKMFKRWGQAERLFAAIGNSGEFEKTPIGFQKSYWTYRSRHATQLGQTENAKLWSAKAVALESNANASSQ